MTSFGMEADIRSPSDATASLSPLPAAGPLYGILALASTGGTLFTIGIYFYTSSQFHWGLRENFQLGAAQGLVYVVGALSAHPVTSRVNRRAALVGLHGLMALVHLIGALSATALTPAFAKSALTAVILAYTVCSAAAWPVVESLVASGVTGAALSRRLGVYNVIWPAVCTATLAVSGWVIEHHPLGIFVGPAVAHLLCAVLAMHRRPGTKFAPALPDSSKVDSPKSDSTTFVVDPVALKPPAELLRMRTVALWVSRLALPATYAVVYGLMPLMPTLPAMSRLDTAQQTVVSSAWPLARWLSFTLLAAGTWWHTRPRVMVAAAVVMGVGFFGILLTPSTLTSRPLDPIVDLLALVFWQVVLGMSLGVIYSGSLYFGMVLSEGSTEHSGYHEALIGLGWVLGPGAGVLAMATWPSHRQAGIYAVGVVIGLSVVCVLAADVLATLRQRRLGMSRRSTAGRSAQGRPVTATGE